MKPSYRVAVSLAVAAMLAGCAVGPDYRAPSTPDLPVTWQVEHPWRQAEPGDSIDKGRWWTRYQDAQLDALQQKALADNPTVAIAVARLTQARATLDASSAARYPQVGLGVRAQRFKISGNRPLTNYSTPNF